MSKYIIEIEEKPLCVFDKDTQTFFPRLWRVKGFNSLVLDKEGLSRLEQLNSDYINEHFGSLQDTAYQRGFEDGKKEAESSEAIEQAKADAFNKGMLYKEEKISEAYQRGFEDGKAVNNKGCEGCLYNDGTKEHSPCDICCNAYLNRWTAKPQEDDDIKVGDEVRDDDGDTYIITCLNDDGTFDALYPDGTAFSRADMSIIYEKTGRHFDIQSILEAMKHD